MKSLMTTIAIVLLAAGATFAQKKKDGNYPANGTWIVESNIKVKKRQTVKFYDAWQRLIYQETITGKTLNIDRPKVRRKLNDALATLLEHGRPDGKTDVVAAALKR